MGTGPRWTAEPELINDCGEVDGMAKIQFYSGLPVGVGRLKRRHGREYIWHLLDLRLRRKSADIGKHAPAEKIERPGETLLEVQL